MHNLQQAGHLISAGIYILLNRSKSVEPSITMAANLQFVPGQKTLSSTVSATSSTKDEMTPPDGNAQNSETVAVPESQQQTSS